MTNVNGLNGRSAPSLPFWVTILQYVLLVLGLGIFITSCYCVHLIAGGGPPAFLLFNAIMIFIVVGGFFAIERWAKDWYFRLAFVLSYTLLIIFLLSSWAWAASIAGHFLEETCYGSFGCVGLRDDFRRFGTALAVDAAFGALAWAVSIVILVFYILASLKDGGDGPPPVVHPSAHGHDAEMGTVKHEQPPTATTSAPASPSPEATPYPQSQEMPSDPQAQELPAYPQDQQQQQQYYPPAPQQQQQ